MSFWDTLFNGPDARPAMTGALGEQIPERDSSERTRWMNGLGLFGGAIGDIGAAMQGRQGNGLANFAQQRQGQFQQHALAQKQQAFKDAFASKDRNRIMAAYMDLVSAGGGAGVKDAMEMGALKPMNTGDGNIVGVSPLDNKAETLYKAAPKPVNYNEFLLPDGSPNTAYIKIMERMKVLGPPKSGRGGGDDDDGPF